MIFQLKESEKRLTHFWLKEKQVLVGIGEVLSSLLLAIVASIFISYLPILLYIFLRSANPLKIQEIRANVIFIIYSICFLFFSTIYINECVMNKKAGVAHLPLKYYFQIR